MITLTANHCDLCDLQLDYCQFLLASHTNYTQTYFAEHTQKWSHDQINRYLRNQTIPPTQVWQNVKDDICFSDQGYLLFDDTVVDKNYSSKIESARRQYSGNAQRVIQGIGIVTIVYVNPDIDAYWIVDYRIFDPDRDGKSKIDHLPRSDRDSKQLEMLRNACFAKQLPFRTVLVDSWYPSRQVLRYIERLEKLYYCPLKSNQLVDDSDGKYPHQNVDMLHFSEEEQVHGKFVHLKNFPKGHRVKLFRLALFTERTEYVATNDLTQDSAGETRKHCSIRWKIEQFHRQVKQVTGLERCQCRKQRAVRNHIGCAMLASNNSVYFQRYFLQSGGKYLATGDSRNVSLWEVSNGRKVWQRQDTYLAQRPGYKSIIILCTFNAVSFSPGGKYIATGSSEKASIWEVNSGHRLWQRENKKPRSTAIPYSTGSTYNGPQYSGQELSKK